MIKEAKRALQQAKNALGDLEFIPMAEVSPLERQLLVEKHLISPAHTQQVKHKAVILRGDEAVSIMVNEEDHFRIQALFPGLLPLRPGSFAAVSTTPLTKCCISPMATGLGISRLARPTSARACGPRS